MRRSLLRPDRLRAWVVVAVWLALASRAHATPVEPAVDAAVGTPLTVQGSIAPAGDVDVFRFEAEAGAALSFSISAKPGLDPTATLLAPDLSPVAFTGPGFTDVGRRFVVKRLALPATGTYTLQVGGVGVADYVLRLFTKPGPTGRMQRLDVRDATLGRPPGEGVYVAVLVGPDGGRVTGRGEIGEAVVDVPAGAFSEPTSVSVATAPAPSPGAGRVLAGPAIAVGPAGASFTPSIVLTIPYDESELPDVADPEAQIVGAPKRGAATTQTPTSMTSTTFEGSASFGGRYVATASTGPRRLAGEYWLVGAHATIEASMSGDSRRRRFSAMHGTISAQAGGTATGSGDWRGWTVENEADTAGTVTPERDLSAIGATWSRSGTADLNVDPDDAEPILFHGASDGSVLATWSVDEPGAVGVEMLLRKPRRPLTVARLAGRWHLGFIEVRARGGGPNRKADWELGRFLGTLTVGSDGSASVAGAYRGASWQSGATPATGRWRTELDRGGPSGTVAIDADGSVLLSLVTDDDEGDEPLRLFPDRTGDVMVGTEDSPRATGCILAWLVRRSSPVAGKSFTGPYAFANFGYATDDYETLPEVFGPGVVDPAVHRVPDVELLGVDGEISHTGTSLRVSGTEFAVRRNPGASGGVESDSGAWTGRVPVSLAKDGSIRVPVREGPVAGALRSDARVGFFVHDPASATQEFGWFVFVR